MTQAHIQAVLGGSIGNPNADNLTPGLDRCNWTLTHTSLSPRTLELSAYRPIASTARRARPTSGYDAASQTLTYTESGKPMSLQLITPARTRLSPNRVRADLQHLAATR